MKPKKIDEVVAKFVIKNLLTICVDTYHEYLKEMIQVLYANAATITTTLSEGKHDQIDLIMMDTLKVTLTMVTP